MAALSTAIRVLHLLGMAVLVGGGAFTWYELRRRGRFPRALATRFERVFWATLGVMVVTGVGNLAAVGAPGPGTRWGTILSLKLALVTVFVLGSFVRTLAVLRVPDGTKPTPPAVGRLHALTLALLPAVVVLAEVLAHG